MEDFFGISSNWRKFGGSSSMNFALGRDLGNFNRGNKEKLYVKVICLDSVWFLENDANCSFKDRKTKLNL